MLILENVDSMRAQAHCGNAELNVEKDSCWVLPRSRDSFVR